MTLSMKAWFRAIAAAFKSEATAQTFAGTRQTKVIIKYTDTYTGLVLLILVLYTYVVHFRVQIFFFNGACSGYAIPKPSMIGALRWITYINVSMHPFSNFRPS
jgi:ATP-binding cassette subfamily G (WHITE) protein 2 (SNQ2)